MQTEYFQGKEGYIWWHGVVEDRRDPLMIGRCRVRILGWHTEDKTELPTTMLPWAQPLMPITSASQVGVGQAPIGPIEGTWVMGYYRDGELAQEPVMVGTLPGIPENLAKKNTGFNDSRLDTPDTNRNMKKKDGTPLPGGSPLNLMSFPFPPKDVSIISGGEVEITEFTHEERAAGGSDLLSTSAESYTSFLNPREVNEPTTSKYARGNADTSSQVEKIGIFAFKNRNRLGGQLSSKYVYTAGLELRVPSTTLTQAKAVTDDVKKITQPNSAYDAVYPFNHVYESESGHLVEIDDTPTKERLHWYHRSGTFTEFHPKGMRVDRTMAHHYDMVSGNKNIITGGEENKITKNDYFHVIGGKLTMSANKDIRIKSDTGSVVLDSGINITTISGNDVIINAKNVLTLKGAKIIRDDDEAEDIVAGNRTDSTQGGHKITAGSVTVATTGEMNEQIAGSKSTAVVGSVKESITAATLLLGDTVAKETTATTGTIKQTVTIPGPQSGIVNQMGPGGKAGKTELDGLGSIVLESLTGPSGIKLFATKGITLESLVEVIVKAVKTVAIGGSTTAQVTVGAQNIQVGGSTEPMVLGKSFMSDLMAKHTHESSVGPTTGISPAFVNKITSSLSKKCFLG